MSVDCVGEGVFKISSSLSFPVANAQPSQPLPALVAPDPRVDSLQNSLAALESRIQSTPFEGTDPNRTNEILAQMAEDRKVADERFLKMIQAQEVRMDKMEERMDSMIALIESNRAASEDRFNKIIELLSSKQPPVMG